MSEFLSKEEIKQWRSSLEKITLEEYAARLGKKIAEDKPTNDLADIVLHGQPASTMSADWIQPKTERITTIAQRAYEREQEISPSPFSISKLKLSINETESKQKDAENKTDEKRKSSKVEAKNNLKVQTKQEKTSDVKTDIKKGLPTIKSSKAKQVAKKVIEAKATGDDLRDSVRVVFKKALTDREQKVFDYFSSHQDEVVYAKDLAVLLDLPRDYVYKYIKNLRAKIEGEKLENADKGGFILHI